MGKASEYDFCIINDSDIKHILQGNDKKDYRKWMKKSFPLFNEMADLCEGRIADGRDALDITEEANLKDVNADEDTAFRVATQQTDVQDTADLYSFNTVLEPVCMSFFLWLSMLISLHSLMTIQTQRVLLCKCQLLRN